MGALVTRDDPEKIDVVLTALRWQLETYDRLDLCFSRKIYQTVEPVQTSAHTDEPQLESLTTPRLVAVHTCRQYLQGHKYRHEIETRSHTGRIRTFDGESVRTLEGSYGSILPPSKAKVGEEDFRITRLITLDAFGTPIADYVAAAHQKGLLTYSSGPGPTRLTLQQQSPKVGVIGIRVVLDREFDYFPVEISRFSGPRLVSSIDVSRVARTDEGFWFPAEGALRLYDYPVGPDSSRLIHLEEFSVNIQSVRVGSDIPEETFRVDFPLGTRVQDFVQQASYVVGSTGTSDLYAASRPALPSDLAGSGIPRTGLPLVRRSYVAIAIATAFVLSGLVIIYLAKFRRRKH